MTQECFVIMPFGDPNSAPLDHANWTEIFEEVILPAVAEAHPHLRVIRADQIMAPGSIINDVVTYLAAADLVVADLTGRNANVFYELGVRHAFGKPTILIAQAISDVPFDLRPYRVLEYGLGPRALRSFQQDLSHAITLSLRAEGPQSNPVTDSLGTFVRHGVRFPASESDDPSRTRSGHSLSEIERRLDDLESTQELVSRELARMTQTKIEVSNVLEDLNEQRTREKTTSYHGADADDEPSIDISGMWHGESGRLILRLSERKLTGQYDWYDVPWAGYLKGTFDGAIVRFTFAWNRSSVDGNGFFLLDHGLNVLRGGWFSRHHMVSLDDAIAGLLDNQMHPWQFAREAQS